MTVVVYQTNQRINKGQTKATLTEVASRVLVAALRDLASRVLVDVLVWSSSYRQQTKTHRNKMVLAKVQPNEVYFSTRAFP